MKFVLAGEKLRGEFALVKTGRDDKSWLLLKKKDRYALKEDILKESRSVVSNKTLEEVFEAKLGETFHSKNKPNPFSGSDGKRRPEGQHRLNRCRTA